MLNNDYFALHKNIFFDFVFFCLILLISLIGLMFEANVCQFFFLGSENLLVLFLGKQACILCAAAVAVRDVADNSHFGTLASGPYESYAAVFVAE